MHTLDLDETLANNVMIRDYPKFGPDMVAYFIIAYPVSGQLKYAILCLDPVTVRWELYDEQDSPLLASRIHYFHVDSANIKWFGTEDGLVRCDDQTWARFTTDNTGLPDSLVREIEYDDVDGVYYVITQTEAGYHYQTAFTILSADGRRVGGPVRFPDTLYYRDLPGLFKDARGIWWLVSAHNDTPMSWHYVWAYDHREIFCWDVREWFDREFIHIEYIGSDALGRTFCVGPTCVMIW